MLAFLFGFLISVNGYSLSGTQVLARPNIQCVCSSDKKDMLEEPQAFAFGKFDGQCIDSCRFRRARVLKKTDRQLDIGNVFHLGGFYSTSVPLENIVSTEIGFEEFTAGIYHIFLRFELKEPILLRSQTDKKNKETSKSLVISAEGVPPKGRKYSLFEAFFDRYLFAIRVTTGEEMQRWITDLKHPVSFYPLKMSAGQSAHTFKRGIEESESKGVNTGYRLFTNNCSTLALSLIDQETGYLMTPGFLNWNKFEMALPIKAPIGTFRALVTRNLVTRSEAGGTH